MSFLDAFRHRPPIYLYNTLTKKKERFALPSHLNRVRMYNCGPTVYGVQHIGNLSMFVFTDVLRRMLEYNGFEVKQVINVTDVGHLTSDADVGEDKMMRGLARDGLPVSLEGMRTMGEKYTAIFLDDLRKLNIDTSRILFPRASDYIPAQIAMIQTLEEKGYAYRAQDGMYFDTLRFPAYGRLGGVNLEGLKEGARVEVAAGKRHPTDFALWKFDDKLGWESPWGQGFPGWHIECSAMINSCLGKQIDIHTGGIEHIPVHHNNEIAQSECATGKKPLSRFWMHRAHIQVEGGKIAKSEGNVVYLSEVIERGFHPLALRYLFLGAHYRTSANFSWEALGAASIARIRLAAYVGGAPEGGVPPRAYKRSFLQRVNDDLDTPGALAVLWEMTKDGSLSPAEIRAGLLDADNVLGLDLLSVPHRPEKMVPPHQLPEDLRKLYEEREEARKAKNYARADQIRETFKARGFTLNDSESGTVVERG